MLKKLKIFIKTLVRDFVRLISKTKIGSYGFEYVLNTAMHVSQSVKHNQTELVFTVPNQLNRFRINTFSSKEPETLEWIDSIPEGSVLWDIGANVGLYSCYAAKSRDCRVFSFEPSVFNLELLARNIFINDLVDQVTIVPIPLSDSLNVNTLNMTTTDWGGALSTFGESYGDDGKTMMKIFDFSSVGMSMDEVVSLLNIPQPQYIKMDVDGIEHLILAGGGTVLQNILGLIIEVNEDFHKQTINVAKYCKEAGLVFKEKRHSVMFDNNERLGQTYNQIWYRP
jgi:FkbM family methyltransferase